MTEVVVTLGQTIRAGDPVAWVATATARDALKAPVAGRVTRIHVSPGDTIAEGWPVVDIEADAAADPPSLPGPPEGPMTLVLTHDGFEAGGQRWLEPRTATDLLVVVAAAGAVAATVWTSWALLRALVMGAAATKGFWCLIIGPGLMWAVGQNQGRRLLRDALGVRRLICTEDHLEIVRRLSSSRVPLRRVVDCLPTPTGLSLVTAEGAEAVLLPWTSASQTAWMASAIRIAAERARQTPLPPEPPDALSRLRRD